MNLQKIIEISLQPSKTEYGHNEIVRFVLVIMNKSDKKQELQLTATEFSKAPLKLLHWFEVFMANRNKPIYVQPHTGDQVLSEPISRMYEILVLDPHDVYQKEFHWNPSDTNLGWWQRLWLSSAGIYRIEMNVHLDPSYRESTPNFESMNRVGFTFTRLKK